jgi:hypothetical protein
MSDLANAEATQETQSMSDIASTVEAPQAESGSEKPAPQSDNISDINEFIKNTSKQNQELNQKVETLSQQQNEYLQKEHLEKVNKEITDAIEAINGNVGGDSELAELYLEKQYRENPDLKKVWDNRASNPEALSKALDLLGKEWAAKNKNVIDPQVAENQRALLDSQSTGGTVQHQTLDDKLDSMSDAEFMRTMRSMRS